MKYTKEYLEENLLVGTKIKIGKKYADYYQIFEPNQIIELVEGHFEYDNGLYTQDETAPSYWDKDRKDWESIYHLFGNDLDEFLDCKIL